MKKSELIASVLLVPVDACMLIAAGLFVYRLRFNNAWVVGLRPVLSTIDFSTYRLALGAVAAAGVVVFALGGLYTITSARTLRDEAVRVVYACATLLVLVILVLFFSRQIFLSRFLILGFLLVSTLFVLVGRVVVRVTQRRLLARGVGAHTVVILGAGETADTLMREFSDNSELGFRVLEHIPKLDAHIGERLETIYQEKPIDEIIVAEQPDSARVWEGILAFADRHQRILKYAADVAQRRQTRRQMSMVGTIPVVEFKRTRLEGWGKIGKRLFDVSGAIILLVLLAPLMALVALMIKLDSRGPIFFQTLDDASPVERIGEAGKRFHYLKFRTMIPQSHAQRYTTLAAKNVRSDGPLVKVANDPRVTRLGRVLRRFSVDELPELFLVLNGSMSLVGPRPHFPEEVARYSPSERRVLTIKPGMTGLAQISGRSDLAFEEEVRLDLYYIENWSLLLDLWILVRTPFVVLRGKAV